MIFFNFKDDNVLPHHLILGQLPSPSSATMYVLLRTVLSSHVSPKNLKIKIWKTVFPVLYRFETRNVRGKNTYWECL